MNIAILIPELEGGGAERRAGVIGSYYASRGHNVYYFLANNRKKNVYEIKGSIINTEIPIDDDSAFDIIKSAFIMRKYKKKYEIEVSISFMEQFNYINILSKRKEIVIANVCTILSQRKDFEGFLYNNRVIRFFYNRADKTIVMADYGKKELVDIYGVKKERIMKIPVPVAKLKERETDQTEQWEYGSNVVICVGRLENVKQHNVAIRAFLTVTQSVPSARMIILGIGSNSGKLKSLIKNLGLEEKVILLGFKKNVAYFLKHAKVFLMTSKTEGFGNSIVEAMSMGLPVVAINSPGAVSEILNENRVDNDSVIFGKYGVMTPYVNHNYLSRESVTREEKQLGKTIALMLSNKELQKRYSKASIKRAEMYRIEKIMNKWDRLIISLKNRRNKDEKGYSRNNPFDSSRRGSQRRGCYGKDGEISERKAKHIE